MWLDSRYCGTNFIDSQHVAQKWWARNINFWKWFCENILFVRRHFYEKNKIYTGINFHGRNCFHFNLVFERRVKKIQLTIISYIYIYIGYTNLFTNIICFIIFLFFWLSCHISPFSDPCWSSWISRILGNRDGYRWFCKDKKIVTFCQCSAKPDIRPQEF